MACLWLRYRGHLDNISNNTLIGATNAFNGETDKVKNQLTGEYGAVPAMQRDYKAKGQPSIIVGDHNYGEGSSGEHAADATSSSGVNTRCFGEELPYPRDQFEEAGYACLHLRHRGGLRQDPRG